MHTNRGAICLHHGRRAQRGEGLPHDGLCAGRDISTGTLPHGLWPSGDGSRICVGLENADEVAVIDTGSNKVITNVPIGQGPQGVAYVPNAVRDGREFLKS